MSSKIVHDGRLYLTCTGTGTRAGRGCPIYKDTDQSWFAVCTQVPPENEAEGASPCGARGGVCGRLSKRGAEYQGAEYQGRKDAGRGELGGWAGKGRRGDVTA